MIVMLNVVFLATILSCASSTQAAEIPLQNSDFEQSIVGNRIPGWARTQHAGVRAYEVANDTESFAHGKQSIRMRRTVEQTYGLLLQQVPIGAGVGKEIELVASLKTAKVGENGWVMLLNFKNHNTILDQLRSSPVVGDSDWSDVTIRKMAPPNTTAIEIGFMLLDGGTGWADNVRVRTIDKDAKETEVKGKPMLEAKPKPKPAVSKDVNKAANPSPAAPKNSNEVGMAESSAP